MKPWRSYVTWKQLKTCSGQLLAKLVPWLKQEALSKPDCTQQKQVNTTLSDWVLRSLYLSRQSIWQATHVMTLKNDSAASNSLPILNWCQKTFLFCKFSKVQYNIKGQLGKPQAQLRQRIFMEFQSSHKPDLYTPPRGRGLLIWIRRPAGVSCGSCLFVVALSVLSLSDSDFPLGADFCLV